MRKPNKLFELIKTMNKTERIYFKRYISMYARGHENNHSALFDAFAAQKEYDEMKLKKRLKNNPALKYFSASQGHLYKIVMRSLRDFNNGKTHANRHIEYLLDHKLLKAKGLYVQSNDMLESAGELADDNDDLISLLNAYHLQQKSLSMLFDTQSEESKEEERVRFMFELIDKIKELIEIHHLQKKITLLYLKYGPENTNPAIISKVSETFRDPLLKEGKKYKSKEAWITSVGIKNFLCIILGDYKRGIRYLNEYIAELERDPFFNKKSFNKNYKIAIVLFNQITNYEKLGMVDEAEAAFKKAISLKLDSFDQEVFIFGIAYTNILATYIAFNMIDKGLAMIPEIEKKIKKYGATAFKENIVKIQLNITIICFMADQYSNALKWVNRIFEKLNKDTLEDIYLEARLLNLFIHFELKNFQLVESLIISLQRFLVRMKALDNYSKVIFNHINILAVVMDKKEQQQELILFKKDLLTAISRGEKDKMPYIVKWIDKKLEVLVKK